MRTAGRTAPMLALVALLVGTLSAGTAILSTPASANAQATAAPDVPTPVSGEPLVVGAGTPSADAPRSDGAIPISSGEEFASFVEQPSPRLASGVASFFDHGGQQLHLALTPDESADSLVAALRSTQLPIGRVDLIAVPSAGLLEPADHQQVAVAANTAAVALDAISLLDPPDQFVPDLVTDPDDPTALLAWSAQLRVTLPTPESTAVFSSGLIDLDGEPVPASLAVAGLIAAADAAEYVGAPIGGLGQPMTELSPAWSVPNGVLPLLQHAAVNPFRVVTGYGTILLGNMTLGAHGDPATTPTHSPLGARRVQVQIESMATQVAASVAEDENDRSTWAHVTTMLDTYLDDLWSRGSLIGPNAGSAYSLQVVPGPVDPDSEDLESSVMVVTVRASTVRPAEYVTVTVQQEMSPPAP